MMISLFLQLYLLVYFSIVCFRNSVMFMTPGLPFVPAIAVTVNIYLIFKLSILTLVRFTVWMILGKIYSLYRDYSKKYDHSLTFYLLSNQPWLLDHQFVDILWLSIIIDVSFSSNLNNFYHRSIKLNIPI